MDHDSHSHAGSIFASMGEVGGRIRSATAGDGGKMSLIPMVEVLDEVRGIVSTPSPHKVLRQHRH